VTAIEIDGRHEGAHLEGGGGGGDPLQAATGSLQLGRRAASEIFASPVRLIWNFGPFGGPAQRAMQPPGQALAAQAARPEAAEIERSLSWLKVWRWGGETSGGQAGRCGQVCQAKASSLSQAEGGWPSLTWVEGTQLEHIRCKGSQPRVCTHGLSSWRQPLEESINNAAHIQAGHL